MDTIFTYSVPACWNHYNAKVRIIQPAILLITSGKSRKKTDIQCPNDRPQRPFVVRRQFEFKPNFEKKKGCAIRQGYILCKVLWSGGEGGRWGKNKNEELGKKMKKGKGKTEENYMKK